MKGAPKNECDYIPMLIVLIMSVKTTCVVTRQNVKASLHNTDRRAAATTSLTAKFDA
jgi:hypothetical protein